MDTDPNIEVALTDDTSSYCIRFRLGNVEGEMHIRSAIDLHHKLGLVISDWLTNSIRSELMRRIAKPPNN